MQRFWNRSTAFIRDMQNHIDAHYRKEPVFWKTITQTKPFENFAKNPVTSKRLKFREDPWREWYYSAFPDDKFTWSPDEFLVPKVKTYFSSPADEFIDRMKVLVDTQKLTPRDAFVQAYEEKSMKMATVLLEQTIAEEQAVSLFGLPEKSWRETMREGTEEYNKAYMLAKERVDRRRREKLEFLIDVKKASSDSQKIRLAECGNMSRADVLSFVEDHPDTAGLFDEAIFLGESKRGPSEPLSPGLRAELLKAGYTPAQLQPPSDSDGATLDQRAVSLLQKLTADLKNEVDEAVGDAFNSLLLKQSVVAQHNTRAKASLTSQLDAIFNEFEAKRK